MKQFKRNIYAKIILLEIVVLFLMRYLVPVLLNYPPYSEDVVFQSQIEPLSHSAQYMLLGAIGIILYILCINIVCKNIFKYIDTKDKSKLSLDFIRTVRKDCFNVPKKIVLVQIILIIIVLYMLFVMMKANIKICFKFLLIYFAFFTVIAIISTSLIKSDLDNIIKSTYKINSNYKKVEKSGKFYIGLLSNLLPFFLVIIITISLLGYAKVSSAIGEGNYNYYKLYLRYINFDNLSMDELKDILNKVPRESDDDYYFIINNKMQYFSSPNGNVTEFFIKYANTYLDKTDGRVYEYYGVEEEGYAKKVTLNDGNTVYVGFKYSTTNNELTAFFVSISIISIIAYLFILLIWAKNISQNLTEITNKLVEISKSKTVLNDEVLPVTSNDEIGELTIAFNDIQKLTKENIEKIHDNQQLLMERERLASLGQLIGGIAHNLKTPIMSISGAAEGLTDLVREYNESIDDPQVTKEDHHAIAKDMQDWIDKTKSYTEYMSDIITAVKGQAVTLSEEQSVTFDIEELLKRVNILMRHELKNALVTLNFKINVDKSTILHGNINSLVQVINNLVSNAIQAYNGEPNKEIDLIVDKQDNNIVISVQDHANGLPKEVQEKLFKEMITTKGKNGTGLGLFMSYSTIRAHFNGSITFETEQGKGTKFNVILPIV